MVMLARHAHLIHQLSPAAQSHLVGYFALPLFHLQHLTARHLCQADLVLALLRGRFDADVELLVGRPIQRIPPSRRRAPPHPDTSSARTQSEWVGEWLERHPPAEPRVEWVHPNPSYDCARGGRSMTSGSFYRYMLIRPGMTATQLLTRGVTDRDLRDLQARGWLRMTA